ncbi:hypothetical protein BJ875DRAFT_192369 [Amylocarpus encephaloides]|uniref:SET domain-containing protein n=1 Tax=Amylocarpus encephaloides TaxID=45428 RepID=A0A9P7Y9E3_9HELO|nr:hypothetical protein BJ875DRAFT_192369 [Amylocarpus encephaloides]
MREDHAAAVNILVHDSRTLGGGTSPLIDSNDQFESMRSLLRDARGGSATKGGYQLIETTNSANHKGAQLSAIAATSYETDLVDCRTPAHRAYVNVKQNFLVEDNIRLDFIPFFLANEDDKKQEALLYKNLNESYPHYDDYVHKSHIPQERQNRLFARIPYWLAALKIRCTWRDLEQFILSKDRDLRKMLRHEKNRQSFDKRFGTPLDKDLEKAAEDFSIAFERVFMPLQDVVMTRLRRDQIAASDNKTGRRSLRCSAKGDVLDSISTYMSTCLICSAIMCPTHGEYEYYDKYTEEDVHDLGGKKSKKELVTRDTTPNRPETHLRSIELYSDELLRNYYKKLADGGCEHDDKTDNVTAEDACSLQCRLRPRTQSEDEIILSTDDIQDIHCCLIAIRNVRRRSCDIARALQLPCWKVFEEINRYMEQGGDELPADLSEASDGQAATCSWYDNKRHKIIKEPWGHHSNMGPEKRGQFEPCIHPGPCTADCICVQNGVLCEEACLCPAGCPHRYTGCTCRSLRGKCCTADSCLCKQLVRECGPQCESCGAYERLDHPSSYKDKLYTQGCQNVKIQTEAGKRLVVGQSEIDVSPPFLGCFTAEPISKGSYIAEYKGEVSHTGLFLPCASCSAYQVVSHDESERRAAIYDFKKYSFLFQLNEFFTVDAISFGNKARYINHAFHDTGRVNCQQTVWWVNGEMRITFTAIKDIAAGEELYFDYGEDFAKAHGFSRLPGGKAGSSKEKRRLGYTAKRTITATEPKRSKKRKLVHEEGVSEKDVSGEDVEKMEGIFGSDDCLIPSMPDEDDEEYDGSQTEDSELDEDEKVQRDGRSVSKELGVLGDALRGCVEDGGRAKRKARNIMNYMS